MTTTFIETDRRWRAQAICKDRTKIFFPEPGVGVARDYTEAKAICAACPVSTQCLDEALENREEGGVWGGLDEMERRSVLRKRSRASRRAAAREIQGWDEDGLRWNG